MLCWPFSKAEKYRTHPNEHFESIEKSSDTHLFSNYDSRLLGATHCCPSCEIFENGLMKSGIVVLNEEEVSFILFCYIYIGR